MTEVQPNFKAPRVSKPRSGVRKQKAGTAAALKRRATKLWGEYIHARDRVCQVCGRSDGKLDAHHVCVRQFNATRADPDNGVLVCFRCHQLLHSDPMRAVEFYTARYGQRGYEALRLKAYSGVSGKYGVDYWRARIEELEGLLS